MLERYAMKVARTVLRGGSDSNATPLPDQQLSCLSRQLLFIKLENTGSLGSGAAEGLSVSHHGIQDGKELTHASRERHLFFLATFQQLLVLGSDQWVVAGCHESRHVEDTADTSTPPLVLR